MMEIKDTRAILATLLETVPHVNIPGTQSLPAVLCLLGIRGITFNTPHDFTALSDVDISVPATEQHQWRYLKTEPIIQALKELFTNCRSIAFDDWSGMAAASDLWDGLLGDVIRPLGKKDLEFIFYLGDPINKLSFQVDEVLDIISDFSRYGQVTFALDDNEAIKLWKILNGNSASSAEKSTEQQYLSIYRTMNIARLLIYSVNQVMLFSNQQSFVLTRKVVEQHIEIAREARLNFIAGFSAGLSLQLNMAECIALGLIVFGTQGSTEQPTLITYINQWMNDLGNL
jgi:hypothetical protein